MEKSWFGRSCESFECKVLTDDDFKNLKKNWKELFIYNKDLTLDI